MALVLGTTALALALPLSLFCGGDILPLTGDGLFGPQSNVPCFALLGRQTDNPRPSLLGGKGFRAATETEAEAELEDEDEEDSDDERLRLARTVGSVVDLK